MYTDTSYQDLGWDRSPTFLDYEENRQDHATQHNGWT